jgi:hypothetical protein
MKKIIFLLTLTILSASVSIQAQDNLDTVYGRQPEYYYTYWYDTSEWFHNPTFSSGCYRFMTKGFGWGVGSEQYLLCAQMHTPQPLKVKGVALMVSNVAGRPEDPPSAWGKYLDSVKMPEYVYLLRDDSVESEDGRFTQQTIIDSVRWDTLTPKVYCLPRTADGHYEPDYCYIYEVMFNTEHTVDGCFSIAGSKNSNIYIESMRGTFLYFPTVYLTFGSVNEDYGLRTYSHFTQPKYTDSIWWQWECGADYHHGINEYFRGYGPFAVITDPVQVDLAPNCTACGRVEGMGVYPIGSPQTFTAIPNDDYHFSHWSDGNESNPRTMDVWENMSLTAYFEKGPAAINPVADPAGLFTLTPNPTTGEVTLRIENSRLKIEAYTITILDAAGHEVLRTTLNSQLSTLNLQSLPAGTYFVTLSDGTTTATQKLMIR